MSHGDAFCFGVKQLSSSTTDRVPGCIRCVTIFSPKTALPGTRDSTHSADTYHPGVTAAVGGEPK
jgi:hypothetical protein